MDLDRADAAGGSVEPSTSFHAPAEECLRADFYDFISALLASPPDAARLRSLAALAPGEDALGLGKDALGRAAGALAKIAAASTPASAEREFHNLFVGLGRGELLPYGSYYTTGFLNEKPLARLRDDMARLGIKRAAGNFEPEDNIASLSAMMAGLILGRFGAPASLKTQRDFFAAHIAPWAEHFFTDLEAAQHATLYAPVGAMGQAFIAIEKEAFRLESATAD